MLRLQRCPLNAKTDLRYYIDLGLRGWGICAGNARFNAMGRIFSDVVSDFRRQA